VFLKEAEGRRRRHVGATGAMHEVDSLDVSGIAPDDMMRRAQASGPARRRRTKEMPRHARRNAMLPVTAAISSAAMTASVFMRRLSSRQAPACAMP
jgi:hypothetical protein